MKDFSGEMSLDQSQNRTLPVIFDNEGDVILTFELFLEIIGHTASHNHHCIFIFAGSLTDHRSRFLITLIGYRAGIYHYHVRRSVKIDQLVSGIIEIGHQCVRFILIQATTKSFKGDTTSLPRPLRRRGERTSTWRYIF